MSEVLGKPENNTNLPPMDFYDALQFELDCHGEGEEFRNGMKVIGKLYNNTSILRTMQQTARFMSAKDLIDSIIVELLPILPSLPNLRNQIPVL